MRRRQALAALSGLTASLAGCAVPLDRPSTGADGSDGTVSGTPTSEPTSPRPTETATPATATGERPDAVALEPVATGVENPVDVAFAPDADRRYVASQSGLVRVHGPDGWQDDPLLDLTDRVVQGYEQGLLGLALHPDFASNRRLFVRYSAPPRAGTPDDYSHTFVLAEVRVDGTGESVVAGSERSLLEIPQPGANHNAGSLVFGQDGYLFVGVGDGGGRGDTGLGHVEDWYEATPGGNGQDVTENLLGSVLRIDVDGGGEGGYTVPDDNPLVGRPGLDEHWAWGLRNPWRLSVDGDDLYAGDVGQFTYEEVNRIVKGGNYGWNVREGKVCYRADTCPGQTPEDVRGGELLRSAVVAYIHGSTPVSGVAVVIGNVYRGSLVPGLEGAFVFGDLEAGNRLFLAEPSDPPWPRRTLPLAGTDGRLRRLYSMARDREGELYVLGDRGAGGGVYRLAPA